MDEQRLLIVVIDDERTFARDPLLDSEFVYLRTSQDAMAWFAKVYTQWHFAPVAPEINQIWFDHDLGEESQEDAIWVARFVSALASGTLAGRQMFDNTEIYVHSQNAVGASNIADVLKYMAAKVVPLPALEG